MPNNADVPFFLFFTLKNICLHHTMLTVSSLLVCVFSKSGSVTWCAVRQNTHKDRDTDFITKLCKFGC